MNVVYNALKATELCLFSLFAGLRQGWGRGGLCIFTGCLFNVLCLRSLFDCHKVSSYLGRDAKLEHIWLVGREIKIKKQRQFRR